jgi:predicted short-subunit dehydrogenase-like oxidoreductase (DUF2520 family)
MTTLNLVGCGRLGKVLARLFHEHQTLQIQDVLTTSPDSAERAIEFIGTGHAVSQLAEMRAADLWMVAVPDRQIAASAAALAQLVKENGPALKNLNPLPTVFHCSGALAASALAPLKALGWRTASTHCILSFANAEMAQDQFPGTPCALEGDGPALEVLQDVFRAIGAQCFSVQSEQKLLYHAAAVFATNFLPVLQHTAENLWLQTGVPAALLPGLRTRLLENATANILSLGPTAALTGPAARGDTDLVKRQAQAIEQWDTPTAQAYRALSEMARRMIQNDTSPPALNVIESGH